MIQNISNEEIKLYKKQIKLRQIGIEGQIKIKKTKILVIGAGGLGCPILIYLVASGVNNIGIIDNDLIDKSNLNRQILYKEQDINKKKIESARKHLHEINTQCKIILHNYKLNEKNNIEAISYYDIVVDATDNFITRYIIDEACYKLNKVYIYGAVKDFEGQIGIFNYQSGIRYHNLYNAQLKATENNCNSIGIMGITTGCIGILQTIQTLKIILGLDKKSQDYIYIQKIINIITKKKYIQPQRTLNKKIQQINDVTKKQKNKSIKKITNSKQQDICIDVKNIQEFINKHTHQSINIPLKKFKSSQTIKLLKKYGKNCIIIIYCNNIDRAKAASKLLSANSINNKIIQTSKKI